MRVTKGHGFQPRSLDAINFLLADVRDALGPYLNVFLVTHIAVAAGAVGHAFSQRAVFLLVPVFAT